MRGMDAGTFSAYLSSLDTDALTRLLQSRPEVLIEPTPRGFTQLAQRLGGAESLSAALRELNRDTVTASQAVAVLGESATVPTVARLLDAREAAVVECVTTLRDRGLAWTDGPRLHLPERLREHWIAEIGGGRPAAKIAQTVLVDDLRVTAVALGVVVDGLRKQELLTRIRAAMADPHLLTSIISGLSTRARTKLDELSHGDHGIIFGFADPRSDATDELVRAGLVLRPNRLPEVPREVAVAVWLAGDTVRLTGRPAIAPAGVDAAAVRETAKAAARDAVRTMSTLLDEARAKPLAALKKGGVGPRERARLSKHLSLPDGELALWIDLAYAAGLLGKVDAGYAPTTDYPLWRDARPSRQWAVLAAAWLVLEHAPLDREVDGDKEHPPPLPLMSAGGMIRRALLAAADRSVRATAEEIDWFCPLHGYPDEQRDGKLHAAVREGELLGVIAVDRRTELGDHLVACASADVEELAQLSADLLPEARCEVILQSDLTAVVSGQPGAAVSKLLSESAVTEARGVWRFSPESIRRALDAGWTAESLLAELASVSSRRLPQPLEYLVRDAGRRHGEVRVRGMRSCIVADEVMIMEIANTRGLAKLQFGRVAPTVLSSPFEPDRVLEGLRGAGLSPVAEDSSGVVIVESRREHQAPDAAWSPKVSARLTPAELAKQLTEAPDDTPAVSPTVQLLAKLNRGLDEAELSLLADAVDHGNDVLITYRDKRGNRTIRQIQPNSVFGRWIDAWCYLREDDREFTVANIETVSPAG
jgi:hypothetical protein